MPSDAKTIPLDPQHTIVEAKAILGHITIPLEAKPQGNSGIPRCHFLPIKTHNDFEIQLRLDWGHLTPDGDPTLDADITKGGKKFHLGKQQWHQTAKRFENAFYVYIWEPQVLGLQDVQIRFKLQTTHARTQTGIARIVAPDPSRGKKH